MNTIYLSSCKRMRAWQTHGNKSEYKVLRRKTEELVGWIRFFDDKFLGRWMYEPTLACPPLTGPELMAIADITVSIKVDHDIDVYGE